MAFLCSFLPGYGDVSVATLAVAGAATIGGDAAVTGRTTSAGFTSSIAGTAGTPAYNWSADPDNGPYYSGSANRCEWSAAGGDVISFRNQLVLSYLTHQLNVVTSVGAGGVLFDADLAMQSGRAVVLDAGLVTDCALQFANDPNTGLYWSIADRYELAAAGADVLSIRSGLAVSYASHSLNSIQGVSGSLISIATGHNLLAVGGWIAMDEIGAAPAAVANRAFLYAIDVATKTQANVRCGAGGTTTQLGIEV